MLTSNFDYELPDELIARHPTEERDGARMLIVQGERFVDGWVRDFCQQVPSVSLVVVNDTRVRRARLLGRRRDTGGRIELLLLDRQSGYDESGGSTRWTALGRPMRNLRTDIWIDVDGLEIRIIERLQGGEVVLEMAATTDGDVELALERHGHVPIPPYLKRPDEPDDAVRYQTVYATQSGSVAAPTAGLHLTERALGILRQRGVQIGRLTLHVGIGTFRPVAVDDLDQHRMHSERFEVNAELVRQMDQVRQRGGRVIAVGTTVVRALESANDPARAGMVRCTAQETRLLVQPGYRFRVVDGLLTNFHQPKSTLLALVAAAIGLERTRLAYREAIARRYRFLSYGDAMWIPELSR